MMRGGRGRPDARALGFSRKLHEVVMPAPRARPRARDDLYLNSAMHARPRARVLMQQLALARHRGCR
eukprot:COSAG02_NODE_1060_length_14866_cov_3.131916_7_plen_67_part_00